MAETEASAVLDRPTTDDGVPLADRGDSLEQFEAIFLGREPTHGGCLSIEGGWGMGRTSLLNAACLTAQRAGCVVLRVAGAKQKHSTSFGVLLRIVESIYPLRPANDEITGRIETVLALIERNGERGFGTLGPAFYELLLATRHIGPVLLAIDDADLVDDATMSTLEYLYERVDDQRIWLLTTSPSRRPGVAPLAIDELLVRHNVRHMALTPLERDGIREVLATQLSVEPDDGFVDTVLEATGGRPEFVVQLGPSPALRRSRIGHLVAPGVRPTPNSPYLAPSADARQRSLAERSPRTRSLRRLGSDRRPRVGATLRRCSRRPLRASPRTSAPRRTAVARSITRLRRSGRAVGTPPRDCARTTF